MGAVFAAAALAAQNRVLSLSLKCKPLRSNNYNNLWRAPPNQRDSVSPSHARS